MGFWRISAKWVRKLLTREQKNERKRIAQELLDRYYREGEQFLLNIVTREESWIGYYDSELKAQSSEYCHSLSPCQKKIQTESSSGKLMLTVFWDTEGVVQREFIWEKETVDSVRYINTLRALKRRLTVCVGIIPFSFFNTTMLDHTQAYRQEWLQILHRIKPNCRLKWESLMRNITVIDFYNFEEWQGYYTVIYNFCNNFRHYWLFFMTV